MRSRVCGNWNTLPGSTNATSLNPFLKSFAKSEFNINLVRFHLVHLMILAQFVILLFCYCKNGYVITLLRHLD